MVDPAVTPFRFDDLIACVECGMPSLEQIPGGYRCKACATEYAVEDGVASFFRKSAPVTGEENDRMEFWNQGWDDTNSPFGKVERDDPHALREAFRTMLEAQRYPAVTWLSEDNVGGKVLLNVGS